MPDPEPIAYRGEQFPVGWNPPAEATVLHFYDCTFATIPVWPPALHELTLDTCKCENAGEWFLPESLVVLKLGFQDLCPARLPSGLQYLSLRKFKGQALPTLPAGLKRLLLTRGRMTQFPDAFPPALEHLYMCRTAWVSLPPFPPTLTKIVLEEQYLHHFPVSPNMEVVYDMDCEFGDRQ
jgi:hypothetical protein